MNGEEIGKYVTISDMPGRMLVLALWEEMVLLGRAVRMALWLGSSHAILNQWHKLQNRRVVGKECKCLAFGVSYSWLPS